MGNKKNPSLPFDETNTPKIYSESEKQKIISDLKAAKKQAEIERINDIFKKYEPHDLKEIGAIIYKAEEQIANKNARDKIAHYRIVLEKINLIINNSTSLFQRLQMESYAIIDPVEYYDNLNQANSFKKKIEIKMAELQADASTQAQLNVTSENSQVMLEKSNVLSNACGTTESDKSDKELMTIEEVASYLGKSKSTIYHWELEGKIPFSQVGRELRFDMEAIENRRKKGTLGKPENNKNSSHEIKKKKSHFTFQPPIDPYTNVFIQNGYLDNENAVLMNDRFSKAPKLGEKLITWKGELKSLITFFYIADRLGFIDKSKSSNVREHNSSSDEYEDEDERKEIQYLALRNIFTISENSGSSEASYTRAWNGVSQDINYLREQVAFKKGIKEEDAKQKITRKETILYCFNNDCDKIVNKCKTLDKKIFNIICKLNK
jgi:excisionase family DNA binding protein